MADLVKPHEAMNCLHGPQVCIAPCGLVNFFSFLPAQENSKLCWPKVPKSFAAAKMVLT